MSIKALVIVVTILTVAFVAAFFVGGDQDRSLDDAMNAGWLRGIADSLLEAPKLSAKDVDVAVPQACREALAAGQMTIEAGQRCTFVVGDSSSSVRTLSLALAQGDLVRVTYDPRNANRLTASEGMNGASPTTTLRIFDEGGSIEVICVDAQDGCIVHVSSD